MATEITRKPTQGGQAKTAAKRKTAAAKKGRKKREPTAPKLREKTKRLILKAFQKTYEAHHGNRS